MDDLNYRFIQDIKDLAFVKAVYVYGSRARGDNVPRSDIDLAIECQGLESDSYDWQKVLDIVEGGADTLLEIDCIRLDNLKNLPLKKAIDRDKVKL